MSSLQNRRTLSVDQGKGQYVPALKQEWENCFEKYVKPFLPHASSHIVLGVHASPMAQACSGARMMLISPSFFSNSNFDYIMVHEYMHLWMQDSLSSKLLSTKQGKEAYSHMQDFCKGTKVEGNLLELMEMPPIIWQKFDENVAHRSHTAELFTDYFCSQMDGCHSHLGHVIENQGQLEKSLVLLEATAIMSNSLQVSKKIGAVNFIEEGLATWLASCFTGVSLSTLEQYHDTELLRFYYIESAQAMEKVFGSPYFALEAIEEGKKIHDHQYFVYRLLDDKGLLPSSYLPFSDK